MNARSRAILRASIGPVLTFILFAPAVMAQSSPSFYGRWVAIPNCDVDVGQLCETEAGFPWVEGIHAMLTHNGKLLLWRNTMHRHGVAIPAWRRAHFWDPVTQADDTLLATDVPGYTGTKDAFCAGHASLGDGRILVVGGEDASIVHGDSLHDPTGIATSWLFDPTDATPSLDETDAMDLRRWYGSPVLLPDGRMAVVSGMEEPHPDIDKKWRISEKIELYDPQLDPIWRIRNSTQKLDMSVYAWMRLLPGTGTTTKLLYVGPGHTNYFNSRAAVKLETLGDLEVSSPSWQQITSPADLVRGGCQVWFDSGKILKTGGVPPGLHGQQASAVATAEVIAINTSNGSVTSVTTTNSMLDARTEHHLTVLPNGKVLATGGMSLQAALGETETPCTSGVYDTEMWNPANGVWSTLEPMTHRNPAVPRMYHSTALLMPDGRIFSSGGECTDNCPSGISKWCVTADYYEPPYLFKYGDTPITDTDRPSSSRPLKSWRTVSKT